MSAPLTPRGRLWIAAVIVALFAIGAIALYAMGHPLICKCGYVKLWHGETVSSENSQHITDWYTPSHIIHGLLFYSALWLVARRTPVGIRALIATGVEIGWEIVENTPWIINRYRGTTISLDYFGDSVINSASDAAPNEATFSWTLASAEITTTGTFDKLGSFSCSARNCHPSITGIMRSSKMRLGMGFWALMSSASLPLAASRTW